MRVMEGSSGNVAEWLTSGRVNVAVLYKRRAGVFPDTELPLFDGMYLVSAPDEVAPRAQISRTVAMELETLPTIRGLVASGTIRPILPLTAVLADLMVQKIICPMFSRNLIPAYAPQRAKAATPLAVADRCVPTSAG